MKSALKNVTEEENEEGREEAENSLFGLCFPISGLGIIYHLHLHLGPVTKEFIY